MYYMNRTTCVIEVSVILVKHMYFYTCNTPKPQKFVFESSTNGYIHVWKYRSVTLYLFRITKEGKFKKVD